MKSFYITITQQFAESLNGKESPVNPRSFFGYTVTNDGQYVCSINSADDFPDDFSAITPLSVISLGIDAFPITPPIQ